MHGPPTGADDLDVMVRSGGPSLAEDLDDVLMRRRPAGTPYAAAERMAALLLAGRWGDVARYEPAG